MDRTTNGESLVEFRVLGPIEARVEGLSVDIGGFRQRRLLALLLSRAGGVVETDALAEYVWDDDDRPDNAVEAARTYISRLRRSFSDAGLDAASLIVTQAPGYRLAIDDVQVDSDRFEQLIMQARSQLDGGDAVSAIVALDDAIALWRGRPYQEFADRRWIESDVSRLSELHSVAIEQRAAARLDVGAHAEVVGELEQLVTEEPLRARPVELLMLALYRSGRQAEALRVGASYRRAVADIGLDPPESVSGLESRIAASDDELRAPVASTDTIRGYQLADKIGEGSFSVVYRSVQPSLGREVAVKQIRAELADRPDFIRRFETEAQTVAALEHPHIVPLYDYWREPGSAYLVMRWLRGGTLDDRLRRQRLDADESVTLATQIGAALATAHHAGIEHHDVRTSNVFVDEIGNNYLGDFGIATDTPEMNGGRDDTCGLGTVLFEAVTGKRPDGNGDRPSLSTLRPDLPDAVERVLLRAIVGAGDEVYTNIEEFVDDFVTAVDGTAARRPGTTAIPLADEVVNPYKGLRSFQESDAGDFRGRDRLIDLLLHQVAEPGAAGRFVAAVGPSGSGKSSLVRAGVIPRIRSGGIAGSDTWFVSTMLPGPRPFDELEAALNRIAIAPTTGLAETMSTSANGVTRAVKSVLPDEASELLLVIDQFEELFTLADDETRAAFIAGLIAAVTDERSRLRVLITIRADHWHRPLQHPDLAHLLETSAVTVTPMAANELERAIVDPARAMGATFEAGLVADIVAEVHDQPGALPLMQYLLTELFDARDAGLMELDTYRRLGGVAGGLARRADDLYEQSTETDQDGIRRLFSRLITPGEGTEDTRRRVVVSELSTIPETVVERYGTARLLTFDHDPATREPTVEVAHEALIREWPRLRGWVDDDRQGHRTLRHLTTAAAEWENRRRAGSELYRGGRLDTAEEWAANHAGDLTDLEHQFLLASVEQRALERETERRRIRRLRSLLATASVVAAIALLAGVIAFVQERRADQNAARATAAQADAILSQRIAESASLAERQPSLAMLIAAEAYERSPAPETLGAVLTSIQRADGYLGHIPIPETSSNDQWIGAIDNHTVVVRTPWSIDVYDLTSRTLVGSTPSASFLGGTLIRGTVGGGSFAALDDVGAVRVIEPGSAEARLLVDPPPLGRPVDRATAVGLGDDGSMILGSVDGARVHRSDGSSVVTLTGHPDTVLTAALDSTASMAATQDQFGNITVWDVSSATPIWSWTPGAPERWDPTQEPIVVGRGEDGTDLAIGLVDGGPRPAPSIPQGVIGVIGEMKFSADGSRLYSLVDGLTAFDVTSGKVIWRIATSGSTFQFVELSDGTLIWGNQVVDDGTVVDTIAGIEANSRVAATPDGKKLVAIDSNGLSIWSTDGRQLAATGVARGEAHVATLDSGGGRLAAYHFDLGRVPTGGVIRHILDPLPGGELDDAPTVLLSPEGAESIQYSADGTLITTAEQRITLRDPDTMLPLGPSLGPEPWGSIEANPDRSLVAIGHNDLPEVRIYEVQSARLLTTLTNPLQSVTFPGTKRGPTLSGVWWIDFSADGRMFAASNHASVAIWDTRDWSTIASIDAPEGDGFTDLAFAPDGRELALISERGVVALHHLDTGETQTLVSGAEPASGVLNVNSIEFSADGDYLTVVGDGASLIDVDAGRLVGSPFPNSDLMSGSIAGDGRSFVTGTDEHLLVWNLNPEAWPEIACRAAGRNMTLEEWDQFGWPDEPYHATCDQWPNAA